MFIKDLSFGVVFSAYAKNHFCKTFSKKYRGKQWEETKKTIIATLERAFAFQRTDRIDNLRFDCNDGRSFGIFKLDFQVAGTKMSPKASGNRVIFSLCNQRGEIQILLVYGKDNCPQKQSETQWIVEQSKLACSQCNKLF